MSNPNQHPGSLRYSPLNSPSKGEEGPENFWHMVAQATSLGWDLAVPIVGGVLLGRYLDDRFNKEFTWTLSLLLGGVAVAFNNLYAMYTKHSDAEALGKRIQKKPKESQDYAKQDHTQTHDE